MLLIKYFIFNSFDVVHFINRIFMNRIFMNRILWKRDLIKHFLARKGQLF